MNIIHINAGQSELCREILDDLPEWFGIPDSNAGFIKDAAALPMIASYQAGQLAGVVSLKVHTEFAVELCVMGVKRKFHRLGVGRALVEGAANFAKARGTVFLTVKTLAPSRPDVRYAATRSFYEAVGFLPIEVFPALWNADNPCLLMLKPLLND
jgi:ribosomal protein S18 acetylase RimI-like enzyme